MEEIKRNNAGAIVGKEIRITGGMGKAVTRRIVKAQHAWGQAYYNLLRNKVVAPKIKLTIWNSLISSTMIYRLRTTEMPRGQLKKIETSTYKHIRTMMNPGWEEEQRYPEKSNYTKKYNIDP